MRSSLNGTLVVIIPGIGGSNLHRSDGTPVWGHSVSATMRILLEPERLNLAEFPDLRAGGALSVAASLPGLTSLHPYDDLVATICDQFADVRLDPGDRRTPARLDANLIVHAYDWRRSIAQTATELDTELCERIANQPAPVKVIILAHSMGGLVARYLLGPLGGSRYCQRLVTFGTPHRGAPKALDWIINGPHVATFRLERLAAVVRTFPSIYELAPRYPAVFHQGELRRTEHLPKWGPAFAAASHIHLDIEAATNSAQPPVTVTPVIGNRHHTALTGRLDEHGFAFNDNIDDPVGWNGDGTVAFVSAVPIELSDDEHRASWQFSPHRHSRLMTSDTALDILRAFVTPSLSRYRAPATDDTIGLAVADTGIVGQPFDIIAHYPLGHDHSTGGVICTINAPIGPPQGFAMLATDDNTALHRATYIPSVTGIHQIAVRHAASAAATTDTVMVLPEP